MISTRNPKSGPIHQHTLSLAHQNPKIYFFIFLLWTAHVKNGLDCAGQAWLHTWLALWWSSTMFNHSKRWIIAQDLMQNASSQANLVNSACLIHSLRLSFLKGALPIYRVFATSTFQHVSTLAYQIDVWPNLSRMCVYGCRKQLQLEPFTQKLTWTKLKVICYLFEHNMAKLIGHNMAQS